MNRNTLAEATTLHDAPVPAYLMEEIADGTKASQRDAEKIADFLLGRLGKSNLTVKLKALQIISYCIREGNPAFAAAIREEENEISSYLQYTGQPDPVYGDEKYRRIRVAAQEALVSLNDGGLPRQNDRPHSANSNGGGWGSTGAPTTAYGQQSFGDGRQGSFGNGPYAQTHAPPSSYNSSQQWGNPSYNGGNGRPAPYSDNPSMSYGGPSGHSSGGYSGGSHPPVDQYDRGGSGYGASNTYSENSRSDYGGGGDQRNAPQQPSGFESWSASSGSGIPSGTSAPGSGMWSSSGYQQKTQQGPSYSSGSARDNRPTVLVGQTLNFSKGPSYDHNGPMGGSSGFNSSGRFSSSGGFGARSSSGTPSYIDNMNKMLNSASLGGFNLTSTTGMNDTTSKIGKTVDNIKKLGAEAKDRWDRRNMDKSIGNSLTDHDELGSGPSVMDRGGYFQPQSMQQGTGGGDASGEYERGMIDNLCASVGLARAPPADALKRFVDLAQTLDSQVICDILLDKLEDSVWQVRLKALHVVLALLESPASGQYIETFEDNAGVFEDLRGDAKPTVAAKAVQVMRLLGLVDDSVQAPKRSSSRSNTRRNSDNVSTIGQGSEVDFLGLESMSLNPENPLNIYGSPPNTSVAPPSQSVSILDGFDPVPQQLPQHNSQRQQLPYQQQTYQHQYQQQSPHPRQPYEDLLMQPQVPQARPSQMPTALDRSRTLSDFGKDLFTIANSPRSATARSPHNGNATPPILNSPAVQAQSSAFSFM